MSADIHDLVVGWAAVEADFRDATWIVEVEQANGHVVADGEGDHNHALPGGGHQGAFSAGSPSLPMTMVWQRKPFSRAPFHSVSATYPTL